TRSGFDLEDSVSDFEDGYVEGATTEVEDEDGPVGRLFVQPVGEGGCRRLVDDAKDVEPGDLTCLFGGLTLGVVEVGGDGDHRIGDGVAEERLGITLHFHEDAGRNLLGGVLLAVDLHGPV